MITALALKAKGVANRVGILDFDQHYGHGTDDIIKTLGVDFVRHYAAGEHFSSTDQAPVFLQRKPELVASMKDSDVILVQSGADPHSDDPLGGWLAIEQLSERDRLVFETVTQLSNG